MSSGGAHYNISLSGDLTVSHWAEARSVWTGVVNDRQAMKVPRLETTPVMEQPASK